MNPLQRAFEDIGQRDYDDTELGPICIGVDAFTGKSIWHRERLPAVELATYSDGTPPDPAHENAGDRAERKTRELLKRGDGGTVVSPQIMSKTDTAIGPQPLYHGFRDPPEPAPSFWRPKLDKAGLISAWLCVAFIVGCLVVLFTPYGR